MKKLANIFVVLFCIIVSSTTVSCDSKPSTTNSYANEGVYEMGSQKTFPCTLCSGYGVFAGYTCNRCGGTGEIVADYVETRSNSDVSFKEGLSIMEDVIVGAVVRFMSTNLGMQSVLIVPQMDVLPPNSITRKSIDTSEL